jgi:hypothetical protein
MEQSDIIHEDNPVTNHYERRPVSMKWLEISNPALLTERKQKYGFLTLMLIVSKAVVIYSIIDDDDTWHLDAGEKGVGFGRQCGPTRPKLKWSLFALLLDTFRDIC